MKTALALLLAAAPVAAAPAAPFMMLEGKIDPVCEKTLPAAAVAKAAKKKVALVAVDSKKGRGGNCNYAAGEDMVLMLQDERVKDDARWEKIRTRGMYEDNHKELPGVGEAAFTSAGRMRNIAVVRKNARALVLTTFLDPKTGKLALTVEQVAALAKTAAGNR